MEQKTMIRKQDYFQIIDILKKLARNLEPTQQDRARAFELYQMLEAQLR